MAIPQARLLIAGICSAFVLVTGIILTRRGKPYAPLLFNVHKLIALGALALAVVTVVQVNRVAPLAPPLPTAVVVTASLSAVTLASGGLANVESVPMVVIWLHRSTTFLTLASAAAIVLLMTRGG